VKRFFSACILSAFCLAVPLWGQTISVALLEDAKGAEALGLSNALLGGCLDRLFDAGFIATNESIGRIDRAGFQSRNLGINAAREGYVDFVALVWIRYTEYPSDPAVRVPESLFWRLMRVRDGNALAEGSAVPPAFDKQTDEERQDLLSTMGRTLADAWTRALRK